MNKKVVYDVLGFDPMQTASEITGKTCKSDNETFAVGWMLAKINGDLKQTVLEDRKDFHCNMDFDKSQEVILSMGFEKLLEDEFDYEGRTELGQVWWDNKRGILAWVESYKGKMNKATFAGNCILPEDRYRMTDGGHSTVFKEKEYDYKNYIELERAKYKIVGYNFDDLYKVTNPQIAEYLGKTLSEVKEIINNRPKAEDFAWIGTWHHEGARTKIEDIDEQGQWLSKWVERPFLWLVHYTETKGGFDSKELTEKRVSRLPKHVQEAITP